MLKRCVWLLAALAAVSVMAPGPSGAAPVDKGDPDACTLAAAGEVGPLITPGDVLIRSQSGHPADGETTCDWTAHNKGLTADAPAVGHMSLAFYHLANPEKAKAQIHRLAKDAPPPGLVRTADPDDQIIRPDATTVVARHGSDIAVVDASGASDSASKRGDWAYRLEALALKASGAQVQGPANAQAMANMCQLAAPDHVLPLLTLSPSTLEASPDGDARCTFQVKDASGAIGGWVSNHGGAVFHREDLGTNAAARKKLHADLPFYPASDLVPTADATDMVVANPDHPEEVWAVHGPYLVTLNLTEATDAARAHPTWAYRVQRAALEAAGATILAKPGLAADPVVAGPPPAPKPYVWRPPAHPAPAASPLIDPLLHVIFFLARWRFFVLVAFVLAPIILTGLSRGGGKLWVGLLIPVGVIAGVVNLIFGMGLSAVLIDHLGVEGQAKITDTFATSTTYNERRVMGHHVLIRTADGSVVEARFDDDDFNIYPPRNSVIYPQDGDEFSARYIQHFPKDFIIVTNDDSPWAVGLRCNASRSRIAKANAKYEFAKTSPAYRQAYIDAIHAALSGPCSIDETERQEFQQDIANIQAGR